MDKSPIQIPMSRAEFIALMAMMIATIAFSIDAMLPALPEIAAELTPDVPTRAPLILTAFVFGMGIGTFLCGPLSDAFGRRNVIFAGASLYIGSAAVAWASQSIEVMLVARICQGIGASSPRIVSIAIIRDLFAGREMARIMSIVMMIFVLVPAVAPALGVLIMDVAGWRSIFMAFIMFSMISAMWLWLRLPETLPIENRRPLRIALMVSAVREMFAHPVVRLSIMAQTLSTAMLFSTLMLVQPIYAEVYDKLDSFPYWFGVIALFSASASLLNAVLVMRLGMRRLITVAFIVQIGLSAFVLLMGEITSPISFGFFALWQAFIFFQTGLTVGNLNAIAMEPMGHIAGMAASVIGGVSTVLAAMIASPIGLLFDGTARPLFVAVFVMACLAFLLMLKMGQAERRLPAE